MKNLSISFLVILSFIILPLYSIQEKASEDIQQHINHLIIFVYGSAGIDASPEQLVKIKSLLEDLFAASDCQRYEIAQQLLVNLKDAENNIQQQIEQLKDKEHVVDQKLFFSLFYFHEQRAYIENYKKKLFDNFSMLERMECSCSLSFKKLRSWFKKTIKQNSATWEELVADKIMDYIEFEQNNILFNYDHSLTFFHVAKKTQLPDLLNFWTDRTLQRQILDRARSITAEVKVQFLEDLLMMMLQSYLMAGDSMYGQWLDQRLSDEFDVANKKQQEIQTEFQKYIQSLNSIQKRVVGQILAGFNTGMKKLSDDYKKVNKQQIKEQTYLFKSINLDYPIQQALFSPPTPYDQIFQASIMNTPKSQQWYNIYQYGDWEFDPVRNSFWQNQLVPFGIPFWQQGFSALQKPGAEKQGQSYTDPAENSIFTEYISNEKTYDIVVECTLINCSYPFFLGVFFNRGRWISADPERIWQYRLCGLYGNQTRPDDSASRSINFAYAQQIIKIIDNKENIISPLEQITTARAGQSDIMLYQLPKTDIDFLAKDAITYVFTIKTSPTAVTLSLAKKGERQLFSTTLNNLEKYLAIFGGIGFMAAGCQAEFKIIKPEKLVFSDADLKNFPGAQ